MTAGASELRFECTGCGKCCTHQGEYAHVYVSRAETLALAALLGLTVSRFKKRYSFVDEYGWTQLRTSEDRCVFLDPQTNACTVYAERPTQCRTFPFWRESVRDGAWTPAVRKLCEGVGQGRLYSIEEAQECMLEMERSDQD